MRISEAKLKKLTDQLLTLKRVLSSKLFGNLNSMKGRKLDYGNDIADISLEDSDEAMFVSISGKEQEVLAKVKRALEKREEGTYGICDISGEEIPISRLEAMPYATVTVEVQRQLEVNE